MMILDTARAYLAVRANGYEHGEAVKTAGLVKELGGLSSVKSMLFNAGGLTGNNNYWPNTFRKLTDPWPERVGFDPQGVPLDQFWRNSTAQSCLSFIQRTFPEARPRVMDGDSEDAQEIENHPLSRLLSRPNRFYTAHRLWQVTLADWWVTGKGNAYWQIVRAGYREPVELWHIPAAEIEPDWPRDGSQFISHYRRTVNGQTQDLDPRDVIHFRFGQDPLNSRKGWSPLMAGASEIANLNEGAVYRQSVLANTGVASHVLTPTSDQDAQLMTPEKVDLLNKLWQSKFTGRNRGGLFIPNFPATLTRAGFSPQEMDIREMLEWDADIICALFGLSSMVLGLPSGDKHRTFANMAEARESAFESNIIPTQSLFAADLELQLLPELDSDESHRVAWDYSKVRVLQDDQDKLYDRLDKAVVSKWMRPSEARAKVSLPKDPELDTAAMQRPEPPPQTVRVGEGQKQPVSDAAV